MSHHEVQDTTCFIVCGLGSLGQYCVSVLKEFGVTVNAIEAEERSHWEIPDLPDLLDDLLIGDCRQPKILVQAMIHQCRAILLVTSNERINIEAAFAARSLNPHVRLIVRSAQDTLNEVLSEHLGNFVAFEATQLPVPSFALAALGGETRAFFTLKKQLLRVARVQIDAEHPWSHRRQLHELNSPNRRILSHVRATGHAPIGLYRWNPDTLVQPGDVISYVEATERLITRINTPIPPVRPAKRTIVKQILATITQEQAWQILQHKLQQIWQEGSQTQRVAIVSSFVMLSLFLIGGTLFKLQYPTLNWQDALNVALVLLIGGYDNLFGQLQLTFRIPWWLHLFSLGLTITGTVFIGILYAALTERVVAARFQFIRRPPIPKANHVVLLGLGRVGQRIATLLQDLNQPLVGIHATALDPGILPRMPLIVGNIRNALTKVNLATAKSIIAVTEDEVANLELALRAYAANPDATLVIRTFEPRFSENVAKLLPHARVLGAYALAAEAYAAAAFGENVLSLFRLNNQTMLVTEYQIEADDTLNGQLLSETAYGYGVVPILHQRIGQDPIKFMPSEDVRLQVGDRLTVLATIEGLQRIERGTTNARIWQVQIEKALTSESAFEGAMAIARISGCEIGLARTLMNHLPRIIPIGLYLHQAHRLVRELGKVQVSARLVRR
ncbi:MAG: NAD-binding protein [Scytolyngbya sp. HA4215-MV1]|jgi:Trk K+ transport system NAD-binding subunit|nr:NAD-binding protein [Scytolyngbya sp. HA4215-MV1]